MIGNVPLPDKQKKKGNEDKEKEKEREKENEEKIEEVNEEEEEEEEDKDQSGETPGEEDKGSEAQNASPVAIPATTKPNESGKTDKEEPSEEQEEDEEESKPEAPSQPLSIKPPPGEKLPEEQGIFTPLHSSICEIFISVHLFMKSYDRRTHFVKIVMKQARSKQIQHSSN